MKLKGELIPIHHESHRCPRDGVHVATVDGNIRGTHAVVLGDVLIPKGSTALYVRSGNYGFKVFYGLDSGRKTRLAHVQRIAEAMDEAGRNFCPRVHAIVGADIDVEYRGVRIQTKALALQMEHVHWPTTFEDYVRGRPYQFDDLPEHNRKGFKRFVKRARKALGEQEYILGNVLYNTRLQRWMLVDVRVE